MPRLPNITPRLLRRVGYVQLSLEEIAKLDRPIVWHMTEGHTKGDLMETEATATGTLVAMKELVYVPNTVVAFDLRNGSRVTGGVLSNRTRTVKLDTSSGALVVWKRQIVKGWWAPAGFRP